MLKNKVPYILFAKKARFNLQKLKPAEFAVPFEQEPVVAEAYQRLARLRRPLGSIEYDQEGRIAGISKRGALTTGARLEKLQDGTDTSSYLGDILAQGRAAGLTDQVAISRAQDQIRKDRARERELLRKNELTGERVGTAYEVDPAGKPVRLLSAENTGVYARDAQERAYRKHRARQRFYPDRQRLLESKRVLEDTGDLRTSLRTVARAKRLNNVIRAIEEGNLDDSMIQELSKASNLPLDNPAIQTFRERALSSNRDPAELSALARRIGDVTPEDYNANLRYLMAGQKGDVPNTQRMSRLMSTLDDVDSMTTSATSRSRLTRERMTDAGRRGLKMQGDNLFLPSTQATGSGRARIRENIDLLGQATQEPASAILRRLGGTFIPAPAISVDAPEIVPPIQPSPPINRPPVNIPKATTTNRPGPDIPINDIPPPQPQQQPRQPRSPKTTAPPSSSRASSTATTTSVAPSRARNVRRLGLGLALTGGALLAGKGFIDRARENQKLEREINRDLDRRLN